MMLENIILPDIIETPRLRLLQTVSDTQVSVMQAALRESRDILTPWFKWAELPETYEISTIQERLNQSRRNWANAMQKGIDYPYYITDKQTGDFQGCLGIMLFDCYGKPHAELGYWMRKAAHGKGYMPEAVQHLTDSLLDSGILHKVTIVCRPVNVASARVAEKAGFVFEQRGDGTLCLRDPDADHEYMVFQRAVADQSD